jgi:hypothetical protein
LTYNAEPQDPGAVPAPVAEENAQPPAPEAQSALGEGNAACTLEAFVRPGLEHFEHNFFFRKVGLAYDYASPPGDFPRSSLPSPKEVRDGTPNKAGIGSGMAHSAMTTCLMFDGYLTRMELGFGGEEEDRVLDRCVAGLIRLATAGQKSVLARGLTPDGRTAYQAGSIPHHTYYAHALLRAARSPAVAMESQQKLRDICGKWVRRLLKDDCAVPALTEDEGRLAPADPHAGAAQPGEWFRRMVLAHLLAVADALSTGGEAEWKERAASLLHEEDGSALRGELPRELTGCGELLGLQLALCDLQDLDLVPDAAESLALLRKRIAHRLLPALESYAGFEPVESIPALDWRADLADMPADAPEEDLLQQVRGVWPPVAREAETVEASSHALLAAMLCGDGALVEDKAEAFAACIREIPWPKLLTARALAPLPLAHALGHEAGLWDVVRASALGEIPFGSELTCEPREDETPMPADGPRPDGWERAKRELPKLVRKLEEEFDASRPRDKEKGDQGTGRPSRRRTTRKRRRRRRTSKKQGKGGDSQKQGGDSGGAKSS